MYYKMKKILWVIGIIILVLVVVIGVGYLTLVARPLKPRAPDRTKRGSLAHWMSR